MDTQATLLAFSEWLDSQGLMKTVKGKDKRTHEDLAREFIEDWESTSTRAPLAGRTYSLRPARELLDALRANWSRIPTDVLSGPMSRLDDALGNPPARNYPPAEGLFEAPTTGGGSGPHSGDAAARSTSRVQ